MAEPDVVAAIDLELLGATESAEPLHPKGFATIETDAVGAYAITRNVDRQPIAWDLATGQRVQGAWERLHPDGKRGLRAEADGSLAVCDFATGDVHCTLEGTTKGAPVFPGPGRFAASRMRSVWTEPEKPFLSIQLWDVETGKQSGKIEHEAALVAALPEDRLLLVDQKGVPTLFDAASGKSIATLKGPKDRPLRLLVSADGKSAVTVHRKGTTNLWDLDANALAASHDTLGKELGSGERAFFALMADGRRAVFGDRIKMGDLVVGTLDLRTGALDRGFTSEARSLDIHGHAPLHEGPCLALLAFHPRSAMQLELWDLDRLQAVCVMDAPNARVIAATPNGRLVIAGSPGLSGGASYFRVYRLARKAGAALPPPPEGAPPPRERRL